MATAYASHGPGPSEPLPVSAPVVWGQQGRDKSAPICENGQTTLFHYVLAPSGTTLTSAGTINVTFTTGAGSDVGELSSSDGGAGHYYVSAPYNAAATAATVTGASWITTTHQPTNAPQLTLSSSGCEGIPTLPPATAGIVTYSEVCGTANDTYTVPVTPNVTYSVAAGTYAGVGTVTVTATANAGYTLTAPYTFTHTFTNEACPVDVCPNIEGDQATVPGGMEINNEGNCVDKKVTICHRTNSVTNPYVKISVSTNAADGIAGNSGGQPDHYGEHQGPVFDPNTEYPAPHNGDQWGDIIPPVPPHHTGLNWSTEGQAIYRNNCNVPSQVDICPNIEGIQLIVPEGLVQDNEGNCITDACPLVPGVQTDTTLCPPGQGGGQVLGTTTTAAPAQLPATLPATGGEQSGPLALVLAMITAYGATYFLQGRRQLRSALES